MKKLMSVMVVACVVLTGCESMLAHPPTLPKGSIACRSDFDCPSSYVCGFADVDQYASCLYKAGSGSHFDF